MNLDEEQLRTERRLLHEALIAAGSASLQATAEFQSLLAETILRAEGLRRGLKNRQHKIARAKVGWHLRRCRAYGDALAWLSLHPFAIRQLAKTTGKPPALSDLPDLEDLLDLLHKLGPDGPVCIVSDLTNILKIGDLIVIGDPERPGIIELKQGGERKTGRVGRQIRRIRSTAEYLGSGEISLPEPGHVLKTIEVKTSAERNWPIVESLGLQSVRTGQPALRATDSEVFCTFHDFDDAVTQQLVEAMKERGFLAVSLGYGLKPLDEGWDSVPPPAAWPIDENLRWLLMEGDLHVAHLIDLGGFERASGGRLLWSVEQEALIAPSSALPTPSDRTLMEVVYGFQTIESAAAQALEMVALAAEWLPEDAVDALSGETDPTSEE